MCKGGTTACLAAFGQSCHTSLHATRRREWVESSCNHLAILTSILCDSISVFGFPRMVGFVLTTSGSTHAPSPASLACASRCSRQFLACLHFRRSRGPLSGRIRHVASLYLQKNLLSTSRLLLLEIPRQVSACGRKRPSLHPASNCIPVPATTQSSQRRGLEVGNGASRESIACGGTGAINAAIAAWDPAAFFAVVVVAKRLHAGFACRTIA